MNADDYLKQYLPDFDTAAKRQELQEFTREELIEQVLMAYKNARASALIADLLLNRNRRIRAITEESLIPPSVDVPPPNFED